MKGRKATSPLEAFRRMHLFERMLPWQGGGQRRRFVPRKEPIKTSVASFSRIDFRGTNAWRQDRWLDLDDWPLKQPAISLWPGLYGERRGSPGLCIMNRPRTIYDVFLRRTFFFFVFPRIAFFFLPFDTANVCTHTNSGLSISADDG